MREEMRTFGYLCPKCGKTVMRSRSVFALAASGAEVECDCGGSALTASFDGERYHLTVPCGLCGETHAAVCSRAQVLEGAAALAREKGWKALRLDVLEDNVPAQRLYRRAGFVYIETKQIWYESTGLANFLLYEYAV